MNAAATPPPARPHSERGTGTLTTPHTHLELPAEPAATAIARRHVAAVLAAWDRSDLAETAQLIISELVSNAIKAAGLDPPGGTRIAKHAAPSVRIWAGLYRAGERVVVEVWDPSRTPPRLVEAGPWDIGGRGLHLVNALSEGWGYRWLASGGKVVWAICSAAPDTGGL